ncbi:hypothetical protein ABK040_010959 [Willaertia magna]
MSSVGILDVAYFFIGLHLRKQKQDLIQQDSALSTSLDPLKLQTLCYYAQAFYLALYDKPLFNEDFYALKYGPCALNLKEKIHEICKTDYQYVLIERLINGELNILNENERNVVIDVFTMFHSYSGIKLSAMSYKEDPYTKVNRDEIISKQSIKEYLIKDQTKLVNLYFITLSSDIRQRIIKCLKENIKTIEDYNYLFLTVFSFNNLNIEDDNFNFKWKHQSKFESKACDLFIPSQILSHLSFDYGNYDNPLFNQLIFFCSKLRHPIALSHFKRTLENYLEMMEQNVDFSSKHQQQINEFWKRADDIQSKLEEYEKRGEEEKSDPYEMGLLKQRLHKFKEVKEQYLVGENCVNCQLALGDRTEDFNEKKKYYEKAIELDSNNLYAIIHLSIMNDKKKEAFEMICSSLDILCEKPFQLLEFKLVKNFDTNEIENILLPKIKVNCIKSILCNQLDVEERRIKETKKKKFERKEVEFNCEEVLELILEYFDFI